MLHFYLLHEFRKGLRDTFLESHQLKPIPHRAKDMVLIRQRLKRRFALGPIK